MRQWIVLILITQFAGAWALARTAGAPYWRKEGRESSPKRLVHPDNWIAVMGDSGVTGAASDPELSANVFTLIEYVGRRGLRAALDAAFPVGDGTTGRVSYSRREFDDAALRGETFGLHARAIGDATIDRVDQAFGANVGRALGVDPDDVVVVGQDGKRVSSIPRQLERVFEVGTGTLPPRVLVSYTANDFCDLGVFTDTLAERTAKFRESLTSAWREARPFLNAHARGTEFVVLAPLDVTNVLTNPEILNQRVPLGMFGQVSCRELRDGAAAGQPVAQLIASKFVGMCPSVLGTKPGDAIRLARLRDVQNAFNEVWKQEIAVLNLAYAGRKISWRYVEGTRHLEIGAGDVANECFHPSASGHQKIAAEILRPLVNRVAAH